MNEPLGIARIRESVLRRDQSAIVAALRLLAERHPQTWPGMLAKLRSEIGDDLGRFLMKHVVLRDGPGGRSVVTFEARDHGDA